MAEEMLDSEREVIRMANDYKIGPMLTVPEVARLLNVHTNTLRRWSDRGIIRAYRINRRGDRRFLREDIALFLQKFGPQQFKGGNGTSVK